MHHVTELFQEKGSVFIKIKDDLKHLPIDIQIEILNQRMLQECALMEYERHLEPTIQGSTRSREYKNI